MSEQPKYLELQAGENKAYVTGIKYEPSEGGPKDRAKIVLTFAEKPTAESYEAPFTTYRVYLPKPDDSQFAKIAMDRNIKTVIFPLAGAKNEGKVKFSDLLKSLKETVDKYDVLCHLNVELTEGKTVNKETGNPMMFPTITELKPVEAVEKVPYESSIDWDDPDLDLPF